MDANKLQEYKSILESERVKHQERVNSLTSDKRREKGAISADSNEAAIDIENDEVVDSLQELEINQVKMIDSAIERIENGTFGTCMSCGEEISQARLKAVPSSPNCIACTE